MAVTKIHAIKAATSKALLYIENPVKTDGQLLVSAYNTEPQTAAIDFEITATSARKARSTQSRHNANLAYHLIQSFSPDDNLTPEQAHEIGKRMAQEFTGGKYEFVIATHVDKGHLHNHIIVNAVSFYDYKKLRTVPYKTARQIRGISDRLCAEAKLSVIESPQQLGQQYSDYIKKRKQTPVRTEIRRRLNFCLDRAADYAEFKQMALGLGIQIKDTGKYVSYRYEGAGKAVRAYKLADTDKYTVNGIQERVENNRAAQEQIRAAIQAMQYRFGEAAPQPSGRRCERAKERENGISRRKARYGTAPEWECLLGSALGEKRKIYWLWIYSSRSCGRELQSFLPHQCAAMHDKQNEEEDNAYSFFRSGASRILREVFGAK